MALAKKLNHRATIYLEPQLHKALRLKAVETEATISDVVNDAVRGFLSDDADDLLAFEKRKKESSLDFSEFVRRLKRDGKL